MVITIVFVFFMLGFIVGIFYEKELNKGPECLN